MEQAKVILCGSLALELKMRLPLSVPYTNSLVLRAAKRGSRAMACR
jgi:hypothetical protein